LGFTSDEIVFVVNLFGFGKMGLLQEDMTQVIIN